MINDVPSVRVDSMPVRREEEIQTSYLLSHFLFLPLTLCLLLTLLFLQYGGVKDSGLGREGIRYAIEEMTEPKLLVLKDIDHL